MDIHSKPRKLPPNEGHIETNHFICCREVVLFGALKRTLRTEGCPFLGRFFIVYNTVRITCNPSHSVTYIVQKAVDEVCVDNDAVDTTKGHEEQEAGE